MKKNITMNVAVLVPMTYSKCFKVTREIEISEEEMMEMKENKLTEEEFIEENYDYVFFREAEKLMEKELDNVTLDRVDFEDYECEFDN